MENHSRKNSIGSHNQSKLVGTGSLRNKLKSKSKSKLTGQRNQNTSLEVSEKYQKEHNHLQYSTNRKKKPSNFKYKQSGAVNLKLQKPSIGNQNIVVNFNSLVNSDSFVQFKHIGNAKKIKTGQQSPRDKNDPLFLTPYTPLPQKSHLKPYIHTKILDQKSRTSSSIADKAQPFPTCTQPPFYPKGTKQQASMRSATSSSTCSHLIQKTLQNNPRHPTPPYQYKPQQSQAIQPPLPLPLSSTQHQLSNHHHNHPTSITTTTTLTPMMPTMSTQKTTSFFHAKNNNNKTTTATNYTRIHGGVKNNGRGGIVVVGADDNKIDSANKWSARVDDLFQGIKTPAFKTGKQIVRQTSTVNVADEQIGEDVDFQLIAWERNKYRSCGNSAERRVTTEDCCFVNMENNLDEPCLRNNSVDIQSLVLDTVALQNWQEDMIKISDDHLLRNNDSNQKFKFQFINQDKIDNQIERPSRIDSNIQRQITSDQLESVQITGQSINQQENSGLIQFRCNTAQSNGRNQTEQEVMIGESDIFPVKQNYRSSIRSDILLLDQAAENHLIRSNAFIHNLTQRKPAKQQQIYEDNVYIQLSPEGKKEGSMESFKLSRTEFNVNKNNSNSDEENETSDSQFSCEISSTQSKKSIRINQIQNNGVLKNLNHRDFGRTTAAIDENVCISQIKTSEKPNMQFTRFQPKNQLTHEASTHIGQSQNSIENSHFFEKSKEFLGKKQCSRQALNNKKLGEQAETTSSRSPSKTHLWSLNQASSMVHDKKSKIKVVKVKKMRMSSDLSKHLDHANSAQSAEFKTKQANVPTDKTLMPQCGQLTQNQKSLIKQDKQSQASHLVKTLSLQHLKLSQVKGKNKSNPCSPRTFLKGGKIQPLISSMSMVSPLLQSTKHELIKKQKLCKPQIQHATKKLSQLSKSDQFGYRKKSQGTTPVRYQKISFAKNQRRSSLSPAQSQLDKKSQKSQSSTKVGCQHNLKPNLVCKIDQVVQRYHHQGTLLHQGQQLMSQSREDIASETVEQKRKIIESDRVESYCEKDRLKLRRSESSPIQLQQFGIDEHLDARENNQKASIFENHPSQISAYKQKDIPRLVEDFDFKELKQFNQNLGTSMQNCDLNELDQIQKLLKKSNSTVKSRKPPQLRPSGSVDKLIINQSEVSKVAQNMQKIQELGPDQLYFCASLERNKSTVSKNESMPHFSNNIHKRQNTQVLGGLIKHQSNLNSFTKDDSSFGKKTGGSITQNLSGQLSQNTNPQQQTRTALSSGHLSKLTPELLNNSSQDKLYTIGKSCKMEAQQTNQAPSSILSSQHSSAKISLQDKEDSVLKEEELKMSQVSPSLPSSEQTNQIVAKLVQAGSMDGMSSVKPLARICKVESDSVQGDPILFQNTSRLLPIHDQKSQLIDLTSLISPNFIASNADSSCPTQQEDILIESIRSHYLRNGEKNLHIGSQQSAQVLDYPTSLRCFKVLSIIGKGAFGRVALARHRLSDQLVAIKLIDKNILTSDHSKDKIRMEISILSAVRHRQVIRLLEVFESKQHLYMIFEYAKQGDLLQLVKRHKCLMEDEARPIFRQILYGLAHLHCRSILHRDIKLDNVLIDEKGDVKICDFGISKYIKDPSIFIKEQCGTPAYIAPEVLSESGYRGFASDVWSIGVLLYAALTGSVPFRASNMKELRKTILEGKYNFPVKNPRKQTYQYSDELIDLFNRIFRVNAEQRITILEILKHPWLTAGEPQNMLSLQQIQFHNSLQPFIGEAKLPQDLLEAKSFDTFEAFNNDFKIKNLMAMSENNNETSPLICQNDLDEIMVDHATLFINEKVIQYMEEKFGFPAHQTKLQIQSNVLNHATSTYYLLNKL